MKILLYILIFNLSAISFAQDPQLFENTWYLQKIIINGVSHYPPGINGEAAIIECHITENNFGTTVCDSRGADISSFDDVNNTFSVGLFVSLAEDCPFQENQIFQDLYFDDFLHWSEPSNTYQYLIGVGANDSRTLTLKNSDNYQAIYGNEALNIQNFNGERFSLYPNPAKNELFLSSKNTGGNLDVTIFNMEGRVLITQNLAFEKQGSLDVSNLSAGIYFLNIKTEDGNVEVKKFIKE